MESKRVRRNVQALVLVAACLVAAREAAAGPELAHSQAYLDAVRYLRAQGGGAFAGHAEQGVLLAEAVAADPLVAGPRSTSLLSSLELSSTDARARRGRVLAGLGLDASADHAFLLEFLGGNVTAFARPVPIWTHENNEPGTTHRSTLSTGYGGANTRLPDALERALVLQAFDAFRPTYGDYIYRYEITDAIRYLLEFRLGDTTSASWPLVRDGEAGGTGAQSDLLVTAEVVLALDAWEPLLSAWGYPDAFEYWVDPDLPTASQIRDLDGALTGATNFLIAAVPANSVETAMRLLALLERLPEGDGHLVIAHADLLGRRNANPSDPHFGSFDGSLVATALAARAILRAADFQAFAFDTDGDGTADGPDPDRDGDGFCDPGEEAAIPGCETDRFPFDPLWHSDSDNDGIADEDPNETDRDGDGVADAAESPAFVADAREFADTDGDTVGDTADPDDDGDGLADVEELLLGLDPVDLDGDTDEDSFGDLAEVDAGTDGADPSDYPLPDGDIHPLGAPDGITDLRDALLAFRILSGLVPGAEGQPFFARHGDVAPVGAGGAPEPDGEFGPGDALVILRRVTGEIAPW